MIAELTLEIPGVPSTNHRARSYVEGGKIRHRKPKDFAAWKRKVRSHCGYACPRDWPQDAQYAVEVIGYMPAARYDADNLRGFLDAAEGVLWKNDRQVRPVIYHYRIDKENPRIWVHVVAYDAKTTAAEIHVALKARGAA